jgi:Cys-rich four helix bundle protein (predicted Tat secretion target)
MNRRDSLIGAGAILAVMAQARAEEMDHQHMHEHMHGGDNPLKALALASADCVTKSELCLAHCMQLLTHGDTSLSACARSVSQTQVLCAALGSLAAQQSTFTPALAKVTMDACKACESECRKHTEHPECLACADSCAACIKECLRIAS